MNALNSLTSPVKQYLVITANYWLFTLTDGALRMLVVLYFYQLGYQPLAIAMLFLFYEVFGVVTNLVGGWLGARIGLNRTMQIGLIGQVIALLMLTVPEPYLTVIWVMAAQALSGIAKDLNKMSAKSSIKTLVPGEQQGVLFKWVAILTGSKNALKGLGFFLGGILLSTFGFQQAVLMMAVVLAFAVIASQFLLKGDLGKAAYKAKFKDIFAKNASLNYLAAARMCLFAARDVWFVVALPVYMASQLDWPNGMVGTFMAVWVMAYGLIQGLTPKLLKVSGQASITQASKWGGVLFLVTLGLFAALSFAGHVIGHSAIVLVVGLLVFGAAFAVNSSLHSYIIVALASDDGVSMDVGFYYMANALGRLLGTILSGVIFQVWGFIPCLLVSAILILSATILIRSVNISTPSQRNHGIGTH